MATWLAGCFRFTPSRCDECGIGDFGSVPVKTRVLQYITLGAWMQLHLVMAALRVLQPQVHSITR